jgi:hypothetical protein
MGLLDIGASLLGGLFGGDDGGSTRAKQIPKSELQKMLENYVMDNFDNVPEYEGDLTTEAGSMEQKLNNLISGQLSGEGLGMSEEEMNKYMGQTRDSVNQQLEADTGNVMERMNQRGILGSDITQQGLNRAQENADKALANAQTNMFLQNEQTKRNQLNNAMSSGMNLAGMANNRQNSNIDRQLSNFYRQQQLNQQPFQNAMSVATGVTMPWQQNNAGIQQGNAQANAQQQAGMWGALGNIGGTLLDNWSQSWF